MTSGTEDLTSAVLISAAVADDEADFTAMISASDTPPAAMTVVSTELVHGNDDDSVTSLGKVAEDSAVMVDGDDNVDSVVLSTA